MVYFHLRDPIAWVGLAFLVGAAQMTAPDHGFPAALLAWRERWSAAGVVVRVAALAVLHSVGGVALALSFQGLVLVLRLDPFPAWGLAVAAVGLAWAIRARRSSRIFELVRSAPGRSGGWFIALSLLGPAEVLIPLGLQGAGLGCLLAFVAGSGAAGLAAIALSRRRLRHPLGLIRAVERIRGWEAWAPWAAALTAVAIASLRTPA